MYPKVYYLWYINLKKIKNMKKVSVLIAVLFLSGAVFAGKKSSKKGEAKACCKTEAGATGCKKDAAATGGCAKAGATAAAGKACCKKEAGATSCKKEGAAAAAATTRTVEAMPATR